MPLDPWGRFEEGLKRLIGECWPMLDPSERARLYELMQEGIDWMGNDISSFFGPTSQQPEEKS